MTLKVINQLLHFSSVDKLFAALQSYGGSIRFIGGCVRDALLNKKPTDIDIATNLLPEQVQAALTMKNIKNIPLGIEHGTVLAIIDNHSYEITTLRKDISTDGRKAIVKFTDDWKEDAQRRDFTINAMSYCPINHKLYDYFNGLDDLDRGVVRFIGNPEQRIKEDYLRILRYFRFLGCYGIGEVEQKSFNACIENKSYINKLSAERKWQEFAKILQLQDSLYVISLMNDFAILKELISDLRPNFLKIYKNLLDLETAYGSEINYLIKLFILVNSDDKESLNHIINTLKLTNKQKKYLLAMQATIPSLKSIKLLTLAYKNGKELAFAALVFYLASINIPVADALMKINQLDDLVIKKLPVSGKDIMTTLQVKQSPKIGKLLQIAEEYWLEGNCIPTKNDLLTMLGYFINT